MGWERRTLPEETEATLLAQVERITGAARNVNASKVRGQLSFMRQAFRTPEDADIVRALQGQLPSTPLVGLPFWTDGAIFSSAGLSTVIYGPIGEGAHTPQEWVSLASMTRVYETIKELLCEDIEK
jgi:acetylornithine deacetylase